MSMFFVLSTVLTMSFPVGTESSQKSGERRGPPPAAFEACANSAAGDACTVETPRGKLTGECRNARRQDKLVCVPEGHDKRRNGKRSQ